MFTLGKNWEGLRTQQIFPPTHAVVWRLGNFSKWLMSRIVCTVEIVFLVLTVVLGGGVGGMRVVVMGMEVAIVVINGVHQSQICPQCSSTSKGIIYFCPNENRNPELTFSRLNSPLSRKQNNKQRQSYKLAKHNSFQFILYRKVLQYEPY